MKLMCVGAHPDDCDSRAGGLAAKYVDAGGRALFVSVTNGNAGHQEMEPGELARCRREEARAAGDVIRIEYRVLDHDDGRLEPTIAIREELVGIIREFHPDLLLGPRPFDYHADHRAAGRLVMDASYLLTVPLIRPGVSAMRRMPVICYTRDGFRKPVPFEPDAVVAIDDVFERKVRMLACHASQMFEWLPYNGGYLDEVPEGAQERLQWLKRRYSRRAGAVADAHRDRLLERYGDRGEQVRYAEAFEICEYGRHPTEAELFDLFPE